MYGICPSISQVFADDVKFRLARFIVIHSMYVHEDFGCVLIGSFRVALRGAARKIKRLVILFVPGYTAGLTRARSRETGRYRVKAG